MKKYKTIIISLLLAVTCIACGNTTQNSTNSTNSAATSENISKSEDAGFDASDIFGEAILYSKYLPEGEGIVFKPMNSAVPSYMDIDQDFPQSTVVYMINGLRVAYYYTDIPVGDEDRATEQFLKTESQFETILKENVSRTRYDYKGSSLYVDVMTDGKDMKQAAYLVLQDIGLPNYMYIIMYDRAYDKDHYEDIIGGWLLDNIEIKNIKGEQK